jgi:hypothetical protein
MPSIQARKGRRQGGEEKSSAAGNAGARTAMVENATRTDSHTRYATFATGKTNPFSPRATSGAESNDPLCIVRTPSLRVRMQRARFIHARIKGRLAKK